MGLFRYVQAAGTVRDLKVTGNIDAAGTLNEIGAFLFKALQTDQSLDSLTAAVVFRYDVTPETARADAADFLRQLSEIGALAQTDD